MFTASQRQDEKFLKDKERVEQERAAHVAKLRALRLAREAAGEQAAIEPAVARPAKKDD